MASISTTWLPNGPGQANPLELLTCLPNSASFNPPVLFIHGAYCSAHDFQFFLPYFASRGYPAYALSLRGHGKSWTPSGLHNHLFTTIDHHASDIKMALEHIQKQHTLAGVAPIVAGHSLGGGYLQYLLGREGKAQRQQADAASPLVSGLVLLGSAPLLGRGMQIMANWETIETDGKGYKYPWSPRSQLDTAEQVRNAFFHDATEEEVIQRWMTTCRTKVEGLRSGLSVMWPFGEASDVLSSIRGRGDSASKRKLLCVTAELDKLITPAMVAHNAEVYSKAALSGDEDSPSNIAVMQVTVPSNAHHMMMDKGWELCAAQIVDWIEG